MVATQDFPSGHNDEGWCVCCASQPVSGVDGIRVVDNRFSVMWEPGQYTTLAPWFPLDGRLGLLDNRLAIWAEQGALATFLAAAYESIGGGNQSWPGWWVCGAWVAGSLYGRTRHACIGHAWIPGWVVLCNRVYLLSTPTISGSETNCSSTFNLVYTP